MPQDIPIEASDTLAFTPACLAKIEDAPKFIFRAITGRETRALRFLAVEEGISRYGDDAIRAEILRGLEELWTPEAFAEHKPVLETYWESLDQFRLQLKDDPKLKWEYDEGIETAISGLIDRVVESHKPLRRLLASNSKADEMTPLLMAMIAVKSWTGIDVKPDIEAGHLTLECAEALRTALGSFEKKHLGHDRGIAMIELFVACAQRFRLDGDEEKNSESPPPSETPQQSSSKASDPGKSPASASSTKTPETA